jgi:hypothetical protein
MPPSVLLINDTYLNSLFPMIQKKQPTALPYMFISQRNHIHNIKMRGRLQERTHKQLRESMRATACARCSFLHLTKTHPNLLRWSPTASRCDTGKTRAAIHCEAALKTMPVEYATRREMQGKKLCDDEQMMKTDAG